MSEKNVVLVTGGNGSVGLNVVHALLEHGDSVVSMSRSHMWEPAYKEFSGLAKDGAFFKEALGDVTDEARITEIIKENNVNYVIGCAALTPDLEQERANPKKVFEVNLLGAMTVMDAARKNGIKRFIQVGSNTTFGANTAGDKPLVDGECEFDPRVCYAISKFAVERVAMRYRELFPDFEVVVCRLGDCWGPYEHRTPVRPCPILAYQIARCAVHGEKALVQSDLAHNWTYHPELAREIMAVLYAPYGNLKYSVYNVSSNTRFPVSEFCEVLKKEFPGFEYEFVGYEKANCQSYDANNPTILAPFPCNRLMEDTGYSLKWDKEGAIKHYISWIKAHPEYMA